MKDELKGALLSASVFVFAAALFEALDLDKLVDRFTPSLDNLFEAKTAEKASKEGMEAQGTQVDTDTDFTAEDLEQDQP